jgi:hypothetical protein
MDLPSFSGGSGLAMVVPAKAMMAGINKMNLFFMV